MTESVNKTDISESPWLELQKILSDFAEKTNLTYEEAIEVLNEVRKENNI